MAVIYNPKGKAREYSELACNLYNGCNHGCKYCYAPNIRQIKRENYLVPEPRRDILKEFALDCKHHYRSKSPVLFSFMTDPYNSAEGEFRITREALKIAYKHKIPVKILTKSENVLNDIDVIKKYGQCITVGMTLTFDDEVKSLEWEPEASTPKKRLSTLKRLHEEGVKTWASFEPVIEPEESIEMIKKSLPYCSVYKVGKLNRYRGIDKEVDWNKFLEEVVTILRTAGKPFYIKKDLREAAVNVKLYGNEVQMDDFDPEPFEEDY